jgi:hypothetical protein
VLVGIVFQALRAHVKDLSERACEDGASAV